MRKPKLKETESLAQGQTATKEWDLHFNAIKNNSKAHAMSTVQQAASASVLQNNEAKPQVSEQ
jgi:hypothetical protein